MGLREDYEKAILVVARAEVKAGSHYLMGGKGEIPQTTTHPEQAGFNTVCFYPDVTTKNNDQIYNTAFIKYKKSAEKGGEGEDGFYLCYGRCQAVTILTKGDVAYPQNHAGFRWPRSAWHNQGMKEDYMTYVDCRHRAFSPALREAYRNHVHQPYDSKQKLGHIDARRTVAAGEKFVDEDYIWGESCRDKRHFDCSGFVNWCLERVLTYKGKKPWYSIKELGTDRALTDDVTAQPRRAGDLGIRKQYGHIGISAGRDTWIHAEWPYSGVAENSTKFSQVVRLNDKFWNLISSVVIPSSEGAPSTGGA